MRQPGPPNQVQPAYLQSPHFEIRRNQRCTPLPATVGSEFLGAFSVFLLLSLYQNFTKMTRIITQAQRSFIKYQPHGIHGSKLSDLHHHMETALSGEDFSLLPANACLHSEFQGHKGGKWLNQRWDSGLLLLIRGCFTMERETKFDSTARRVSWASGPSACPPLSDRASRWTGDLVSVWKPCEGCANQSVHKAPARSSTQ